MNNFKDFLTNLVSEANAQLEAEPTLTSGLNSRTYHSVIDSWCESHNDVNSYKSEDFQKEISTSSDRALSGYDSRYMSRNDWRVAKKFQHSSTLASRKDNEESKWDYLFASQGLTQSKVSAVVTRQYDVTTDKKSKATIKKNVATGKGSYMPTTLPVTKKIEYTKPCNVGNTYKVVDFIEFPKAIVLEVATMDKFRANGRFDEVISEYDSLRNTYFDEDSRNKDKNTFYIVFTYQVIENGKEAEYSGINQLRNWLKTQKFIMEQKPTTIREAVQMLVGETITLPRASQFTYSNEDDKHYVYTVFGEFDTIKEQFNENNNSYKKFTEYTIKDKDCFGYEAYEQEVYAKINLKYNPVSTYDCHKEFIESLPLTYNHIDCIFD